MWQPYQPCCPHVLYEVSYSHSSMLAISSLTAVNITSKFFVSIYLHFPVFYNTKLDKKMIVPDEIVIEALLKDAKRFKSKWELRTNEPSRVRPNIKFLKRTLSNVVKTNKDLMRKPNTDHEMKESKGQSKPEELKHREHSRKSRSPSKSRCRSPKKTSKKSRKPDKSKNKSQ